MDISNYIDKKRIVFSLKSKNKNDIIKELAYIFKDSDILNNEDIDEVAKDIIERENMSSTGMQDGIAIPHTRSSFVKNIGIAIARIEEGVDFDSLDEEPSRLFFMILAPEETKDAHLDILAVLAKLSFEEELLDEIMTTDSLDRIIEIVKGLD